MNNNPLLKLEAFGQSIWIDFIRRGTILSGELKKLIDEDGVTGVTSNPSIFEKAIGGSDDYDKAIHALARRSSARIPLTPCRRRHSRLIATIANRRFVWTLLRQRLPLS